MHTAPERIKYYRQDGYASEMPILSIDEIIQVLKDESIIQEMEDDRFFKLFFEQIIICSFGELVVDEHQNLIEDRARDLLSKLRKEVKNPFSLGIIDIISLKTIPQDLKKDDLYRIMSLSKNYYAARTAFELWQKYSEK